MSLSRRLFLNRIGITTVAAAAVALPPAACTVMQDDDAELVHVGKQMDAAEAAYLAADDAYRAARSRCEAAMPGPPSLLVVGAADAQRYPLNALERMRDVDDFRVKFEHGQPLTLSRWWLEDEATAYDALPETDAERAGRRHCALVNAMDVHDRWEMAREQTRLETGFTQALEARDSARRAVDGLAKAAFAQEAKTPRGLQIQARAFVTAFNLSVAATVVGLRPDALHLYGSQLALATERVLAVQS